MIEPDLPLPPPFMWACRRCTDLLIDLALAAALSACSDLHDGVARHQVVVAGHLVDSHLDEIPGPHTDCPRCAFYETRSGTADLWAEHRARDLFLPARIARLM